MKVLVMGGTGFIGKNICNLLEKELVDYNVYSKSNGSNPNYILGNIIDDDRFDEIIKDYECIIYLIASGFSQKFMENPAEIYNEEISMLIKTLNSCLKSGIKRIVFASSGGTVYGDGQGRRQKETDLPKPINHYGICKLTSERILLLYNELYNMENICLRISNPYGEGQNPNSGVGLITTVINKILNKEDITVYGDGSTVRDYIDIETVAKAFYLALNWNFNKEVTPIFNIGSGQELTVNKILEIVQETLNEVGNITYKEIRPFDVHYSCLDIEKMKATFDLKIENQEDKIKDYVLKFKKSSRR